MKKHSKTREFKKHKFGKREKGAFLETFIGFERVYKRAKPGAIVSKETIAKSTEEGHRVLKESGLPVVKRHENVKVRGEERFVFEKARTIKPKEVEDLLPKIREIVKQAIDKKIFFDTKITSFGINKEGKVVIRDTNLATKMGKTFKTEIQGAEEKIAQFMECSLRVSAEHLLRKERLENEAKKLQEEVKRLQRKREKYENSSNI